MTAHHLPRLSRVGAALALTGLAATSAPALAQDPPARAGRIAYLSGPVSLSPAGSADWAQAPLNRPLVAGDRLWTEPGARDEAQFGPVIARMDGGTLLSVLAADEGATQLQLSQGRIDLHVRRVDPGAAIEIDTPNLAFVVRAPGDYRIAVAPDGASTDVAALRGAGDVYGDGNAYNLGPGQAWRFAGQDLQNLGALPIQPYDDFDRWAFARDQRLERSQSARFVPADLVGYEDLDDYGAWRDVPDYGTVWVPTRVAQDWAPYHDGHWAWIDPWGWTWVDDQPWGYAVSHYGRWASIEGRWAWVPSPPRERPVYAPALVAFVGAALTFGAADGPGVGWFPLGPREPYRPPYHASPAYVTRINISNTPIRAGNLAPMLRDADRIRYVNRAVPGALMAMPAGQFAQAAPAGRYAHALAPRLAMNAPLMLAPGARPLPQSRIGTALARQRPPEVAQRRVAVARALPMGFGRAQGPAQAFAQHGGAPLRMLRPAPVVRPGVPPPHGPGAPRMAGRAAAPMGGPDVANRFAQPPVAPDGAAPDVVGHGAAGEHGKRFAGRPGEALAPASAPYPMHGGAMAGSGQRWAGAQGMAPGMTRAQPGEAGPHGRAGVAHGAQAPLAAPAAHGPDAHGAALVAGTGRPEPRHDGRPSGAEHAFGRSGMQEMRAGGPEPRAQQHGPRPQAAARPEPQHPQAAPRAEPRREQAAPRPEAPRPQPAPHPEPHPAPHPEPQRAAPAPHPQAAPPHQEPPHPPAPSPQAQGGGHGGGGHGGGHGDDRHDHGH